ncbi:uncharacterized protein LOC128133697 [Lactuca sativa]|uniref:uncharacterized protein LOC128133697 n=1 Tax=Lactuca sativa TaxID=4236 RepID=UPI0022AF739A|nr:uncharacterized protein LOC128133697 [Lactuca sativa]
MESVLHISKCLECNKVEYATFLLQDRALTWWNTLAQTRGHATAYQLTWEDLKKLLIEEYCPKDEIQKLESEFWNHSIVGTQIEKYTVRFNELAKPVPHMVTPEEKQIDRYIWGLAPDIRGMVTSANPTTIKSAVTLANRLTNDMIRTKHSVKGSYGEKRKIENQGEKKNDGGLGRKQKTTRNFMRGHKKDNCPSLELGGPLVALSPTILQIIDGRLGKADAPVVRRSFLVNNISSMILFDLELPDLSYLLRSTRARVHRDCVLEMFSEQYPIDLVPIPLCGNMVIMGIHWLSPNGEVIDYECQMGCPGYIAYVMEIWEKGNVTIDDVPIIREYLDVFPEDFPRVPPERKVDVRIDLVLGTAKIAKASSRLAPPNM